VGFLLAGILAGPFGLGLIRETENIEVLAEIGVVLLLFTIGIEFSLRELLKLRRIVILGGGLQVFITTLIVSIIFWWLGYSPEASVFMGLIVALSSTAIVLKLLQEKGEIYSAHGRIALGILIFQDIAAVFIIILAPLLAGEAVAGSALLEILFRGIGLVLLTLVSARYVVPFLLFHVAKTRNNELFLLSIVVIGLAVAWITSLAGLSLALGAFLAGLIISESEYAARALGNVMPFRDMFMSIFFVSTGMLLDLDLMRTHLFLILAATVLILFLKTFVNALATFIIGFPLHTMILVGFSLAQIGVIFPYYCEGGLREWDSFRRNLSGVSGRYRAFYGVNSFFMDLGHYSAVSSQTAPPFLKHLVYDRYRTFQEEKKEKET